MAEARAFRELLVADVTVVRGVASAADVAAALQRYRGHGSARGSRSSRPAHLVRAQGAESDHGPRAGGGKVSARSITRHDVQAIEGRLASESFVKVWQAERDGRITHVALTNCLRRRARRGHVWANRSFLATLSNAAYGYDPKRPRSQGGLDGVFPVDRDHRTKDGRRPAMVTKLFDGYLDRRDGPATELAAALGVTVGDLHAVRVVSHHMRLLGVLVNRDDGDWLVLVDYDM